MANENNSGAAAVRAGDVCRHFNASEPALAALDDRSLPSQFLRALVEKQLFPDAIQLIAHYLPKRQAVWWACQCAKSGFGAKTTPQMKAAVEAAEKWVAQPSEENRRAAHQAAELEESGSAAHLAALAASFAEQPPAADPRIREKQQFMTAKLAAGAVLLAATVDAEKAKQNLAEYVSQGITVVNRTYSAKEA
ncbi:MAG TPA: hypothetical protein VE998_12935 [Terriglobales bacterium]|nr:hypothetical protein [Terriglobales bacterium]